MSAGLTQALAPGIDKTDAANTGSSLKRTLAAAVVGGTASEVGGGKFSNGAITAAFSRNFNDDAHNIMRKVMGALQTIGGAAQMVGGAIMCAGVVTCAAGGLVIAHGAGNVLQGFGNAIGGDGILSGVNITKFAYVGALERAGVDSETAYKYGSRAHLLTDAGISAGLAASSAASTTAATVNFRMPAPIISSYEVRYFAQTPAGMGMVGVDAINMHASFLGGE